ncbi:hypothetical protein EG835_08800, partial [bacterium]|nr:hypothetical protein [bacterium]
MSIARFAIRGITSDEALSYLVDHCQPMELTLWQTVYALQRTGVHPHIRENLDRLVTLHDHADPLLRMNLALLLGRYRGDVRAIGSLQAMANGDSDWRVRANAVRFLALADTLRSRESLLTYVNALEDENSHVGLAALAGLAEARWSLADASGTAHDLLMKIASLSQRTDIAIQVRGEATLSYATIMGSAASETILGSLSSDALILAYQLRGLGLTGSARVFTALREATAASIPSVTCAAIDGALSLAATNPHDTALAVATRALALSQLDQPDVAVTATAASALGAKALQDTASVRPLMRRLQRLRAPEEIEAIQEVCRTLALLRDTAAIPALEVHLQSPDAAARSAAREAVTAITGSQPAPGPLPSLPPAYTDFDFDYLRALPARPRVALETTRGTIVLELVPEAAPFTVMSFLKLALGK